MALFVGFFTLLLLSMGATRLLIWYALRRSLIDRPNERSSHAIPTPRGGGMSIVVIFLLGIAVFLYVHWISRALAFAISGGGVIVAATGFLDDHRPIAAKWRVLVHFIAAGWALYWLGGGPVPVYGSWPWFLAANVFWLVALVWFLNSYNFMDGVDGMAGAEAVFIAGAAGVLFFLNGYVGYGFAAMAGILLAAVAGFLWWNLPPARIFMGDVGSGFLGIVLGVLAIASMKAGMLSFWVWAILFGVFVVDPTITIFRRMWRGARWYEAHRSHAYQHAARRFGKHGKVTGAVTVINVFWLFPLAVAAWSWPHLGALVAAIAYLPLIWLAFRFNAGMDEKKENHKHVQSVAELV